MITVGTVSDLDHEARKIRLTVGDNKTAWLPWPAENGRNYTRWRPLKKGQQFVLANPSGDMGNGLIVGEIYSDEIKSNVTDSNVDHIEFSNGNYVKHDINSGRMSFAARGGFEFIGNMDLKGKLQSTGDQVAGTVSTQEHEHEKTAPHPYLTQWKAEEMTDRTKEWATEKLSLATFAVLRGAKINGVKGRVFLLLSHQSKSECETEFVNSELSTFNNKLIELNILRRG